MFLTFFLTEREREREREREIRRIYTNFMNLRDLEKNRFSQGIF